MNADELETKVAQLERTLEETQRKLRIMEDTEAIKKVQRAYGYYLEHMMVDDIVDLFADGDSCELWVSAGKFKGKEVIKRLYSYIHDSFDSPEFLHQLMQLSGIVDVDPDGATAKGRWYGFGAQALPLKNGKINPGWMNGIYEAEYIKQNETWKIQKLRWCMTFRASWTTSFIEPSRRDDSPTDRPQNDNAKLKPTETPEETRYPSGFICPFHFNNPASGRKFGVDNPS